MARASIELAQAIKHRDTPSRRDAGIAADSLIQLANILRRLDEPERIVHSVSIRRHVHRVSDWWSWDNETRKTEAPFMTVIRQSDESPTMEMLLEQRTAILSAVAKHGASNLRVYGSVARGKARPGSDIDVLVDMEDGRSLLDLAGLHLELEELLGHPVEIGTDVKPRLRSRVHAEAITL